MHMSNSGEQISNVHDRQRRTTKKTSCCIINWNLHNCGHRRLRMNAIMMIVAYANFFVCRGEHGTRQNEKNW